MMIVEKAADAIMGREALPRIDVIHAQHAA
jgi:hypothetical protein